MPILRGTRERRNRAVAQILRSRRAAQKEKLGTSAPRARGPAGALLPRDSVERDLAATCGLDLAAARLQLESLFLGAARGARRLPHGRHRRCAVDQSVQSIDRIRAVLILR